MKLAEAVNRLAEYETRIEDLKIRIARGPLQSLAPSLDEFNNLVIEKQKLKSAVEKVETETFVGGTSLSEIKLISQTIDEKISTLRSLSERKDIPDSLSSVTFSQLDSFVKTKSQLLSSVQKISWDIEINI